MEKKVMTKRDYTEVVRIKSAVQMLGYVIEGLEMGTVLGAVNSPEDVIDIINNWTSAKFLGGRHEIRVNMIER